MILQEIFNAIVMDRETISVPDIDATGYQSLRVSLLRKFKTYKAQCQQFDIEGYEDLYLRCSYDAAAAIATFKLLDRGAASRRNYTVIRSNI